MIKKFKLLILLFALAVLFPSAGNATNILVIEPSRPVLRKLNKVLHRSGYSVFTVRRWGEALKIMKYELIKLIVMNHYLLSLSGIEAVKHIREEIKSDVKILYIAPELANRKRALEAGADDYLISPANTRLMLRKVKLLLEPLEVNDEYLRSKGLFKGFR